MSSTFLKFTGPMRTLTQRGVKFEKGKIYRVDDEERALDMIESGRFQQVRDPTKKKGETEKPTRRGGVQITRNRERTDDADMSERGDLSRADLHTEGDADDKQDKPASEKPVQVKEDGSEDDPNRPKLPAQQFTSKNGAIKWAKDNLGINLDKTRSLSELNRTIVTEFGKKYSPPKSAEQDDDDTREENTTVDAVVVA